MTDQTKLCPHCGMSIPESANVCYQCKRSQGSVRSKLESVVPNVSIILSIVLVSLSVLQFRAATEQRNSADRAVQSAGDALKQADAAKVDAQQANAEAKMARDEAGRARDEARDAVEQLRTNIKLVLEVDHLTPKTVMESYDPVRVGRVRQKLEEFAVPNEKERKKWLESLK